MPIYCYRCPHCSLCDEVAKPMSQADTSQKCSVCGNLMQRNFGAENVNTSNTEYATPLISDSLAMSLDQIPAHRKQFPDVKIHEDGRPEFTSVQQHDKYLKKCNMVKQPKKKRARSKVKV